ncbi:hypothetical protein BH23THE1_BH23THE1_20960 [soil metagenome]
MKQKWQVNSNSVTNELKVSSISILANGLLFALEFGYANAVLKLIIVISSLVSGGPGVDIHNTVIFLRSNFGPPYDYIIYSKKDGSEVKIAFYFSPLFLRHMVGFMTSKLGFSLTFYQE